ncbi:hypothetical protein KY290_008266 [Solanum tuberosum]|uniref:Uncharacterized protein n=1 Tax=Solanum tuberosum TaxID=4113 RepID=A0ABQ7W8E8_SOLTU|nr:hypothetical protein KY290_008266 [Solanum tuberosum]
MGDEISGFTGFFWVASGGRRRLWAVGSGYCWTRLLAGEKTLCGSRFLGSFAVKKIRGRFFGIADVLGWLGRL